MGADEKKEEVITAVYKLNLHCQECARAVEKAIIRSQGVHKVDIDVASGKVAVKGVVDPKKMHGWIGKKSRRQVEWISPKPKEEKTAEWKEEQKEKKEEVIKTIIVKVHLHSERCEHDIRVKLLKLKGVHTVKTSLDAQSCTVVGTIEEKKLIKYLSKTVHKHGVIVPPKEEEKDKKVEEMKKAIVEVEGKEESKEEVKVEEIQKTDVVIPYFIYCTHAPQWFSDEDPNAIM